MTDPMQNGENVKKSSSNLIIGILAIIVIILFFTWIDSDKNNGEQSNDGQEVTNEEGAGGRVEPSTINMEGISPDDWELTQRAEDGINTLTSGQEITFSIIQDPANDNVVYFASQSFDDSDEQMQIGIYRYRLDTYNFERLFRRSYKRGYFEDFPEDEDPIFHVLGYDKGNLILLVQGGSDSPGVCAQPLLLADDEGMGRHLWSMSIENPYDGFEEYELPADIREMAEDAQEECLEALEL